MRLLREAKHMPLAGADRLGRGWLVLREQGDAARKPPTLAIAQAKAPKFAATPRPNL